LKELRDDLIEGGLERVETRFVLLEDLLDDPLFVLFLGVFFLVGFGPGGGLVLGLQLAEDVVYVGFDVLDDIGGQGAHARGQDSYVQDALENLLVADQTVAERGVDELLVVADHVVEVLDLRELAQHRLLLLVQNLVGEVVDRVLHDRGHPVYEALERLQERAGEELLLDVLHVLPARVQRALGELRLEEEAEDDLVLSERPLADNQVQRFLHLF